jgi:FKBP-type peptidyl-prolyl cis-trans isomerase
VNTTFRVGRIGLSAVRRTLAISVIFLAAAGCGSSKAVSTTATAPKSAVTAAPAKAADSALPTVSGAAGAKPVITMPTSEPPTKLIINVLTEGTGAAVKAGQQIKVQYSGQIWKTGAQFDASWDRGAPIEFGIGTGKVIKGWDEGLVGQKIGSRVLLVIPPDKGYGASGRPPKILGTDTMVFVVDIVDSK